MFDNDQETTEKIDTLEEILEPTQNIEEVEPEMSTEEPKSKEKKRRFKKIKEWWKKLSKKKKILFSIGIGIAVIVVGIGIFFLVKNLHKEEIIEEKPQEVIIEQENYRYENGKLIFLNKEKEEIGVYECENKDESLCRVAYFSDEDHFDAIKKVNENDETILERTPIVKDTFAFIKDNKTEQEETIQIYNLKTSTLLDGAFRLVKKADNDNENFILKDNTSNYGVVHFTETDMETKIPFQYDYLGFINTLENYYISKQANRNVIINEAGKNISKSIQGNIVGLTKKYIKVTDEQGKYNVYDYNGKTLFSNYEYVELYEDYVALIKENKMALKFYDGSKLHEEEINLFNNNYNKIEVYDENNKRKETKESFWIEENGNTINVNVVKNEDTKITKINKLEGQKSQSIKYLNYFDGKLYIYKDTAKENLLGIYTCNNKNTLTSATQELTNCFLAKDTIFENNELTINTSGGIIPIINERFVFIKDNPDLVNDSSNTVILYDLQKKSTISKYNAVNSYMYTNSDEITFQNKTSQQIAAKNKSGKYGVIKIGTSGVSSHIPFNYDAIEKLGDYYSANNGSGYLLLSQENGTALFTNPIAGKIQNYNDDYITGIENNRYYVYKESGEKVTEAGYTYIALYPIFFAAVDSNNQLSLHTYENPNENLLEKPILLNLTKYYGSGTLAFKISTSGLNYTVEVGTNVNTYETKASGTIIRGDEE